MLPVVLAVWIVVVAGVDAAAVRPWRSPVARAPLPIGLGLAVAVWVLATGAYALQAMTAAGAWTGASLAMPLVPMKAIALSLIAYAAGRTFLVARSGGGARKYVLPAILAAIVVYAVGSDVRSLRIDALERHAANPALTAAEASALLQRVRAGQAGRGETAAFLRNPRCPPEVLAEYAASPEPSLRTAVAANDAIDAVLAGKLAADPDEQVRYFLAFNRKLPPELLTRLAADPAERVRETTAWTAALSDEAFNRLVEDQSPKVRATAAIQSRLTSAQVKKLQNDPEPRVRDAANRRWASMP